MRSKISGRLLLFLFQQLASNLVNNLVGQHADFILELGLNRMRDQNGLILRHTKGRTLGVRGAQKLRGRDICSRNPSLFQRDDIVRTARYTAASIAERFNDRVALFL